MKSDKYDKIIKKYKEAFEQLENYDKTRELDIGKKRTDKVLMVEKVLKEADLARLVQNA